MLKFYKGKGKNKGEACRELEISEAAYYRWRKQYGNMQVNEAERLRELEKKIPA